MWRFTSFNDWNLRYFCPPELLKILYRQQLRALAFLHSTHISEKYSANGMTCAILWAVIQYHSEGGRKEHKNQGGKKKNQTKKEFILSHTVMGHQGRYYRLYLEMSAREALLQVVIKVRFLTIYFLSCLSSELVAH